MIIGEAPGYNEDTEGEPFVGRAGELLDQFLAEVGLSRDSVYITNAVRCRPPDNRAPTKAELRKCHAWTQQELRHVRPRVVLLLGAAPLAGVLGLTGIKKIRGQPIERDGVIYLPALHPAYVLRDERARPLLRSDLRKFKAMIDGGGLPKIPGLNHRIVRTRLDVEDMLDDLRRCGRFVFDLETTGLYPWHEAIISMGIGTDEHQWIILINHPKEHLSPERVEEILTDIDALDLPKANHNCKFDSLFLLIHYGLQWLPSFDTMLAHYILDENALHGLDIVAGEKYGALDWDVPLAVKQGKEGSIETHARYLGTDLLYTYRLWEDLEEEIAAEPAIAKVFAEIVMPAARMFVDIENRGIYIDESKFAATEEYLHGQIALAEQGLGKHFPGVNWASTKQVSDVLFNKLGLDPLDLTKGGAPSTSESVLKRLAPLHPVPSLLMKRREASQQLSFFINGWKPYLHNHRLHPSFKIHGTVTGRLSCENPNLQQVPRDPRIRQLIKAPPGWELIEADLSQIELRIVAEISGDSAMMRAFQTDQDIHWLTAMRDIFRGEGYRRQVIATARAIAGHSLEYEACHHVLLRAGPDKCIEVGPPPGDGWPGWKEVRKKAKGINFGYVYGMWWKKFKEFARDNYDIILTDKESQESRVAFFDTYPDLPQWHRRQRRFANKHGYVRSLFGRKRRLPHAMSRDDTPERREAERQAINSPVQSFASDLNLAVAFEMRRLHPPTVMRIVGTVHDSLLIECRVDHVRRICDDILNVMRHPPLLDSFGIELSVPIEGEVKIGPWGLGVSPEKYYVRSQDSQETPPSDEDRHAIRRSTKRSSRAITQGRREAH